MKHSRHAWMTLIQGICIVLALIAGASDRSSAQSAGQVMYISSFNFDCYADTVIGDYDKFHRPRPTGIRWGKRNPLDEPCSDTSHHPLLSNLSFSYPAWSNLWCSVTFDLLNDDTLTDLLIYIHGQVGSGGSMRDTAKIVVIMGQNALDSVPVANLAGITGVQISPFFAVEAYDGVFLNDRKARDPSGRSSFVLAPFPGGSPPSPRVQENAGVESPWQVRIYPNPAIYATNVEIRSLPSGEYHVEIVSSNGQILRQQDVSVDATGDIVSALDLKTLSSGYYVIRLFNAHRVYGTYPILIVR